MSPSLKVIALISGGKDSLFSILHCMANGHEVVALANLYPSQQDEQEDIDSYMYQTVGHGVIPLYEEALAIPLYRQKILGVATNTDKDYLFNSASEKDADETESLIPLLEKILVAHPNATAISTGAILSDYQRTRVESVAIRMRLTPLSYLWQYPNLPPYTPASLLEDIAAVGQESRIIKVASGGLTENHLWLNLALPPNIEKLFKDMRRFGGSYNGALLGEGGEFETLTLDGPSTLWKRRIEVLDAEKVSGRSESATYRIKHATTMEKHSEPSDNDDIPSLRIPERLDKDFTEVLQTLNQIESANDTTQALTGSAAQHHYAPIAHCFEVGSSVFLSNLTARDGLNNARCQMEDLTVLIRKQLRSLHLACNNITFVTILLRSISDFAEVNRVYSSLFDSPNPPPRVTVSCGENLMPGLFVTMSIVVDKGPWQSRRSLHVQSRSYWAPANIGPYSQAVSVPLMRLTSRRPEELLNHALFMKASTGSIDRLREQYRSCGWMNQGDSDTEVSHEDEASQVVYVAGQIPLVPASMEIVSSDFREQTVLSLQHLWRIGQAMQVDWWTGAIAFITSSSHEQTRMRAEVVTLAWHTIHEKNLQTQHCGNLQEGEAGMHDDAFHSPWTHFANERPAFNSLQHPRPLPDWTRVHYNDETNGLVQAFSAPPCVVIQVHELPRNAAIEWSSIGLKSSRIEIVNSNQEMNQLYVSKAANTDTTFGCTGFTTWEALRVYLNAYDKPALGGQAAQRYFEIYTSDIVPQHIMEMAVAATVIPCKSVWVANRAIVAAVRCKGFAYLD